MKTESLLLVIPAALLCACCAAPPEPLPEVKVTLDDGQVLVGALTTRSLELETGLGSLRFDSVDAGELGLVEGKNVEESERMIRLWLRNGSEFVGRWQEPDIALRLSVGGEERAVMVPIEKLGRLQFKGASIGLGEPMLRIWTRHGDDFFAAVDRTRLAFTSDFGRFQIFLSELEWLRPLDDENKLWRIQLTNGSVFKAALEQEQLELRLAMGPSRIALPLDQINRIVRQSLGAFQSTTINTIASQQNVQFLDSGGAYYSNQVQKNAKMKAAELWMNRSGTRE